MYRNVILAQELLEWQKRLENNRKVTQSIWAEIASYIRPERNCFTGKPVSVTAKNIYDSTAVLASEFLVSALWSMVSSSSNEWFNIKPKNLNLLKDNHINTWFQNINEIMKKELLNLESGFYHKSYEFYSDLVCFGTSIFYVGENSTTNSVEYICKSLSNCFLDYSDNNNIDIIFRKVYLLPSVAIKRFGINNLSNTIKKDYEEGNNVKKLFIHAILPKKYISSHNHKINNFNYVSCYIESDTKNIVSLSGYHEFPYIVARWFTTPNQIYGESPAMLVLPNIKMLNAMCKTMIVALQKQVDPPILAPNEAVSQGIKTTPGGVIYRGIDPVTGNQLFKPLVNSFDLTGIHHLEEQKRQSIREAFYFSLLFSTYARNATNATATEVLSVNEQRMQLLGAKISRIQTEFLYPLLIRQYKVMYRLHKFPPVPENFSIEEVDIEFFGVWNRYQKMVESVGLNKLINMVHHIKPLYPQINDAINWEKAIHILGEGNGVPFNLFNM